MYYNTGFIFFPFSSVISYFFPNYWNNKKERYVANIRAEKTTTLKHDKKNRKKIKISNNLNSIVVPGLSRTKSLVSHNKLIFNKNNKICNYFECDNKMSKNYPYEYCADCQCILVDCHKPKYWESLYCFRHYDLLKENEKSYYGV